MTDAAVAAPRSNHRLFSLTLGSLGIVYGDIGTSPLYAFRESLAAIGGAMAGPPEVLGLLSLVFWTLLIIVTVKYILLLLRADNDGEGGILSLMALAKNGAGKHTTRIILLGMIGASLFYGDAVITPAISVLSAVEGVHLLTHAFDPYIVPAAILIMVLLFVVQEHGTARVARFFGPVMALWFVAMALGGLRHLKDTPGIWHAIFPNHAIHFLTHHGFAGIVALGSVFLCVTGAEALYADLGHFGKKPIRLAWIAFVFPALLLNYFGQGALILKHPEAAADPFYLLYPGWALPGMVILATLATIIASQAVITGAFSLTYQAIRLGLLPRLQVYYTSQTEAGQIYVPHANWLLFIAVITLILLFRSSSHLAAAYSIAVTGTMVITALLTFIVMRQVWRWSLGQALAVMAPLLLVDVSFLGANMVKIVDGGYVPLLIGASLLLLMRTWVRGRAIMQSQLRNRRHSMEALITELRRNPPLRVAGTAVYLRADADYAPSALLQNLKHNRVLHEHNIFVTLRLSNHPHVPDDKRIEITSLDKDFIQVFFYFGYMESPNLAKGVALLRRADIPLDLMTTSFFISRRHVVASDNFGMPLWQDRLFIGMMDFNSGAASYFRIPSSRVVEMGTQVMV